MFSRTHRIFVPLGSFPSHLCYCKNVLKGTDGMTAFL